MLEFTPTQDRDPVRQGHRIGEIMGHVNCGLPGATRSKDGKEFAVLDRQVYLINGNHGTEVLSQICESNFCQAPLFLDIDDIKGSNLG